jgi:predicted amidophosphoribosyltransferase
MSSKNCPQCGNPATGNFCSVCGAAIGKRFCNQCGEEVEPGRASAINVEVRWLRVRPRPLP